MEIAAAVVGIVVAIVIGIWQIYLARQQIHIAKKESKVSDDTLSKEPEEIESFFLARIWNSLDSDLQDALSMAYNQARREGVRVIKTRYFLAAIARLKPYPLRELFSHIPENALPQPISEDITSQELILRDNPLLSACVEDSLVHLSQKASPERKLSTEDVFVDIARHGTGTSVARLRTYGVTPDKVDSIVKQLGWRLIER